MRQASNSHWTEQTPSLGLLSSSIINLWPWYLHTFMFTASCWLICIWVNTKWSRTKGPECIFLMLKTRFSSLRGWWYQSGGCWAVHFDYWCPVSCQFYFCLSSFVASDKAPALKSQVEHRSYRHAVKLIDSTSCWSAQYTPAMFIHWEYYGINYSMVSDISVFSYRECAKSKIVCAKISQKILSVKMRETLLSSIYTHTVQYSTPSNKTVWKNEWCNI